MKKFCLMMIFIFTAALILGSCGKGKDSKLLGKWKWDAPSAEYGEMTIEFTKDKVMMEMKMPNETKSEKDEKPYTVKSDDGKTIVVESPKKGTSGEKEDVKITVDGDKMTINGADGTSMNFSKAR